MLSITSSCPPDRLQPRVGCARASGGGLLPIAEPRVITMMKKRMTKLGLLGGARFRGMSALALELESREGHDLVGPVEIIEARYEDTFAELGQKFGLGYTEMLLANPKVDPLLPGEVTKIVLTHQFLLPSGPRQRSEEHTSELQSREYLVCRSL